MKKNAGSQLKNLIYEIKILVGNRRWRWLTCWWGGSAGVIMSYRIDRFFYLLLGQSWGVVRIFFFPLFLLFRLLSANHQIHYRADVGRGLRVLHPALGVVVSGHTVAGENLILTGGNCIGGRKHLNPGELRLGNNVSLGANAVVLGPLRLGNRVYIGAGAVVVKSFPDDVVLVGVPARVTQPVSSYRAGDENH